MVEGLSRIHYPNFPKSTPSSPDLKRTQYSPFPDKDKNNDNDNDNDKVKDRDKDTRQRHRQELDQGYTKWSEYTNR